MRSPEIPSRRTAWIGMPPATLASIARLILALIARSQISAPHSAISSLFAVTMDLPCAVAPSMISLATVVPPTSSATISTLGSVTTSRQSEVRTTSPRPSGKHLARDGSAADRRHAQPESQLQCDLIGIGGQNGKSARADIAEPDYANMDILHGLFRYDSEMRDSSSGPVSVASCFCSCPPLFCALKTGQRPQEPAEPAASSIRMQPNLQNADDKPDVRLPNGKRQTDEILKAITRKT